MSKTLSLTRAASRPAAGLLRRAAALSLRTASLLLARLARRLRATDAAAGTLHLPVVEFHPSHREAGAPEGALYVDGELVGYVHGVTRL